ncbi:PUA-like domain-containing protein [Boletus coccyginus]|nr:PUA-like domain-containing protein [Boletus coccyginus]
MLSYAEERAANIVRNRKLLASIGVEKLKPTAEPKETRHKDRKKTKPPRGVVGHKRKADAADWDSGSDTDEKPHAKTARVANNENAVPPREESTGSQRRSSRIAGKPADAITCVERTRGTPQPISVKALVKDTPGRPKRERRHNPKTYGSIPGIDVGSWWASRCIDEVSGRNAPTMLFMRGPWVGGIAPGPDGAYSVALSGGYDDDVDDGYALSLIFCSTSGRDLKGTKAAPKNLRTAEQSFDQSFEHNHNKALKRSVETGKPVRVIRGYKLRSKYGPSEGYRYDGLYTVNKYWQEKGLNKGGFLRLPDQLPIPVNDMDGEESDEAEPISGGESDAEGDEE